MKRRETILTCIYRGYRQVTCCITSIEQSTPIGVNLLTTCSHATLNIGGIPIARTRAKALLYHYVWMETLLYG